MTLSKKPKSHSPLEPLNGFTSPKSQIIGKVCLPKARSIERLSLRHRASTQADVANLFKAKAKYVVTAVANSEVAPSATIRS